MNYKVSRAIIVDCERWGFGPFSVTVIIDEDNFCHYSLTHKNYGKVLYMFGQLRQTYPADDIIAEEAYNHSLDYMSDYVREIAEEENNICPF